MAQLDKTFPTNDCAMCILAPKMIECATHENIELLTYSELVGLTGEAGDFTATVLRKARFIDEEKCVGCGDCIEGCPIIVSDSFNAGLGDRKAIYKYFPQAVPSTFAIDRRGTAPCKAACPAHISVQGYVALTAQGRYRDALKLIKKDNPLPAICGRVCHHPCESVCTRGNLDEPVAIDFIKRFVADLDLNSETRHVPQIKEPREEQVAVIGAGPAGLTCAYYLAIEGYRVTIFEKLPVSGGMLAAGIPEYRLPRSTINAEIEVIKDLGVEIKTGVEIGKDVQIQELREKGFKAFFLGIGSHLCRLLNIEGEDLEGVTPGVDFLRDVNLGNRGRPGRSHRRDRRRKRCHGCRAHGQTPGRKRPLYPLQKKHGGDARKRRGNRGVPGGRNSDKHPYKPCADYRQTGKGYRGRVRKDGAWGT